MIEENQLATVDLVCVDPSHIEDGRRVPDTYGALKLKDRRWAYCSASLSDDPHLWQETGGVEFGEIHHMDLPGLPKPRRK